MATPPRPESTSHQPPEALFARLRSICRTAGSRTGGGRTPSLDRWRSMRSRLEMKDTGRNGDDLIGSERTSLDPGVRSDQQARVEVEAALAREYRFQAALSQALGADAPEQGLAEVLHEHLGLGVAVEDPFGRVLARAGRRGPRAVPAVDPHPAGAPDRGGAEVLGSAAGPGPTGQHGHLARRRAGRDRRPRPAGHPRTRRQEGPRVRPAPREPPGRGAARDRSHHRRAHPAPAAPPPPGPHRTAAAPRPRGDSAARAPAETTCRPRSNAGSGARRR